MMTLIKTFKNLPKILIKKILWRDSKIKFIKKQFKLLKKFKKMDMTLLIKSSKIMKINLKKSNRKISWKIGKNIHVNNVKFN